MKNLADLLEALAAKATPGPWAWDQRGEKINEWGLGVAMNTKEEPYAGRFDDEDAIYVEQVCQTEGATVNYTDPDLICALRNNLSEIIEALRARRTEVGGPAWVQVEKAKADGLPPRARQLRPVHERLGASPPAHGVRRGAGRGRRGDPQAQGGEVPSHSSRPIPTSAKSGRGQRRRIVTIEGETVSEEEQSFIEDAGLVDALKDCFERHKVPAKHRAVIMKWATDYAITHAMVENIKNGAMDVVGVKKGQVHFSLTPQGIQYVENMLPADLKKQLKK